MATAMEINAELVKKLRDQTGAGMMECKKALVEAKGNLEDAVTILRKQGLAQATKKAGRSTNEGMVGHYIHMNGKIGVLVEVNCESDFVARTEDFQSLTREIAMHIAAANPQALSIAEVDPKALERERNVLREQAASSGKPAAVIEKMVEGRLRKYYEDVVLLEQVYVIDGESRVSAAVEKAAKEIGAPVKVTGFRRFALGEGIERKEQDFAAEVAAQAGVAR
jgi:elongation factor Ts